MSSHKVIYYGSRGNDFKTVITNTLKLGNLKNRYIDLLTTDSNMKLYGQAFTALTASQHDNYEVFEHLGDRIVGTFIVWYMYRRFPQLKCSNGVKVVARLLINYGSSKSFSKIADELGFWPFISAQEYPTPEDPDYWTYKDSKFKSRSIHKEGLLEDSLEAFFGVTASILDELSIGAGYGICYHILAGIFDKMPISLEYESLYDDKSILKETFDQYRRENLEFGELKYVNMASEPDAESRTVTTTKILWVKYAPIPQGQRMPKQKDRKIIWSTVLAEAQEILQDEAEQAAAKKARETLKRMGYVRAIPKDYALFCV